MKRFFLVLFIIGLTASCEKQSKIEIDNTNVVGYGLLNAELEALNGILKKQINSEITNDNVEWKNSYVIYDSITNEYVSFLDNILNQLADNVDFKIPIKDSSNFSKSQFINDYFFKELDYNQKAEEFIRKTNEYRTEILKLVEDENLVYKIELVLQTHDPQMRNGEIIKYLNYYYKDKPLINVFAYINYKKKNILELQLEFLKNQKIKPVANKTYN